MQQLSSSLRFNEKKQLPSHLLPKPERIRWAAFYIICPDNETTEAQDRGRMQWAGDDLVYSRVPLSRWSEQYKEEYAAVSKGFV